jgi:hypothetical protein
MLTPPLTTAEPQAVLKGNCYVLSFGPRFCSVEVPLTVGAPRGRLYPIEVGGTYPDFQARGEQYSIRDRLYWADGLLTVERTWDFSREGMVSLEFLVEHGLTVDHWMIPGVVYDGNRVGRGAFPSGPLSRGWASREDRCTLPSGSVIWAGDLMLAVWTDPAESEHDLSAACLGDNFIGVAVPLREEPFSYTRKWLPRPKPKLSFWQVGPTTRYRRRFHVFVCGAGLEGYAEVFARVAERLPAPHSADVPWGRQISLRAVHLHDALTLRREDAVGVPTLQSRHLLPIHPVLSGGFVGRNLDIAAALLTLGKEPGYEFLTSSVRDIADGFLAARLPNGLCYGEYSLCLKRWYGYYPFRRRQINVRLLAEIGEGWLGAAEAAGEQANPEWIEAVDGICRFFVEHQLPSGSFGRWWSEEGVCLEDDSTNGADMAYLLLRYHAFTGDESLVEAARRYLEHARRRYLEPWTFYGETLDADCIDKEAAYALLRFWLEWHPEAQIIEEARELASWLLTWTYAWNVPFPPRSFLGRRGFLTRGGTTVSVAHHHLDAYGVAIARELFRLGQATGEECWPRHARLLLHFATQCLADERDDLDRPAYLRGFQPEQFNQTDWDYLHTALWGKGSVKNLIAWVPALVLRHLLLIREEFPEEVPGALPVPVRLEVPERIRRLREVISRLNPF